MIRTDKTSLPIDDLKILSTLELFHRPFTAKDVDQVISIRYPDLNVESFAALEKFRAIAILEYGPYYNGNEEKSPDLTYKVHPLGRALMDVEMQNPDLDAVRTQKLGQSRYLRELSITSPTTYRILNAVQMTLSPDLAVMHETGEFESRSMVTVAKKMCALVKMLSKSFFEIGATALAMTATGILPMIPADSAYRGCIYSACVYLSAKIAKGILDNKYPFNSCMKPEHQPLTQAPSLNHKG